MITGSMVFMEVNCITDNDYIIITVCILNFEG